jgi:hypothetical protein
MAVPADTGAIGTGKFAPHPRAKHAVNKRNPVTRNALLSRGYAATMLAPKGAATMHMLVPTVS